MGKKKIPTGFPPRINLTPQRGLHQESSCQPQGDTTVQKRPAKELSKATPPTPASNAAPDFFFLGSPRGLIYLVVFINKLDFHRVLAELEGFQQRPIRGTPGFYVSLTPGEEKPWLLETD